MFSDVIEDDGDDDDDDDVERAPKMSTFKSSSLRQHGSTAQRRTSTAGRMRVRGGRVREGRLEGDIFTIKYNGTTCTVKWSNCVDHTISV